jgi:LuxR family maltose regulon positive regulatory protein
VAIATCWRSAGVDPVPVRPGRGAAPCCAAAEAAPTGRCGRRPAYPKEAHVLGLLSQGMSNKLIARAMEISEETVKWHLKNLFAKLSAGTRKHASAARACSG